MIQENLSPGPKTIRAIAMITSDSGNPMSNIITLVFLLPLKNLFMPFLGVTSISHFSWVDFLKFRIVFPMF